MFTLFRSNEGGERPSRTGVKCLPFCFFLPLPPLSRSIPSDGKARWHTDAHATSDVLWWLATEFRIPSIHETEAEFG
ncbi:hypothetical protein IE53DRAFT_4591 [Violaceomyces palustris]|uniref:Uncharacterized protein n=1 Tax=Violaceomyces palustris TaxID=1673888 RepID=A0ACD0NLZ2_9BASI|nr:hypothetical protein IE53DRAFT_4591 [Violaceomyces palustris]